MELSHLPKGLTECSGMAQWSENQILMHNDGGNKPILYLTDTLARLQQKVQLSALPNNDWEALALDRESGWLYIGDFGNNANERQNLQVHKVKLWEEGDSLRAGVIGSIYFKYGEQSSFPPAPNRRNYDCESMIYHGDSLYLFTKNRTEPFTGYTYQYALPADTGHYIPYRQDSFKTGRGLMPSFWVVDASWDQARQRLALLGYDKLWLIEKVSPPHFLRGQVTEYNFNHLSQKEALTLSNSTLWIGEEEERRGSGTGMLYRGGLKEQGQAMYQTDKTEQKDSVSLASRVIKDTLSIELFGTVREDLKWEIFSMEGQRVRFGTEVLKDIEDKMVFLELKNLPYGGYVINVIFNNQPHAIPFQKSMVLKEE